MSVEPGFEAFAAAYGSGRVQVVWRRIVDDLETPVSAWLKIARGKPYPFLFESVEGGAWRGRYSIITFAPDLVWRCRGDKAEISQGEDIVRDVWTEQEGGALDSLRTLVAASRFDLPKELPPMAAGLFGAIGYDLVRLVEPLGQQNPDPFGLPDAIMTRPIVSSPCSIRLVRRSWWSRRCGRQCDPRAKPMTPPWRNSTRSLPISRRRCQHVRITHRVSNRPSPRPST